MQFSTVFSLLFAGAVVASPVQLEERQQTVCTGTYGNAQCCATDVLGLVILNCENPTTVPTNATEFTAQCSDLGQQAKCCALPVLGQALLCQDPTA